MFQIKTMNKIAKEGLHLFEKSKYEIDGEGKNSQGWIVRSKSLHEEILNEELLCIARAGAGTNNIPMEQCSKKGIVVFNTPGANANSVKELTLCGLLMAARNVYQGMAFTQSLTKEVKETIENQKAQYMGHEIHNKTLGIIGLGAIGVMVANAASDLGMEVYGYDPYISVDRAWGLKSCVQKAETLDELLKKCDCFSLHVPLMKDTKMMINEAMIKKMRKGSILLNFSRGELVDDDALLQQLGKRHLSMYVTDFPNESLLGRADVLCIPHLGASTKESENNCAIMAVRQVKEFLENGNIINSVNFPTCVLERTGKERITVCHANIPNMLGQISSMIAKHQFNILNMINKGRDHYAYTVIDLENPSEKELLDEIRSIEGVVGVRQLSKN